METTTTLPTQDTWDLTDLFANDAAFRASLTEFRATHLPGVDRLRGRLLESPAILADALEADSSASEQLRLLHCYASLRADQDVRVSSCQAMREEVGLAAVELAGRTAFLRPEILAADPRRIEEFLAVEPRLAPHAFFLRDLARQRDHVLSPAEEHVIAETGLLRGNASALYGILTDDELPRPELTLSSGETVRLTTVAFQRHRTMGSRADRLALFPAYFSAYAAFGHLFGRNLYTVLKDHLFEARVRHFPGCLAAALHPDNVPVPVYRKLIEEVHRRLPTLHRYFGLRAGALGVERLEYPDLYGPLAGGPPRRYSVDEARRLVVDALAPLGTEYRAALEQALAFRWLDWHPGPGKRSGAYATGWAYRVHPYVLLNFNGDRESVLTTAHELGHALHSWFSNRSQPFPTADYSIFVAEVASTFSEALVVSRMLEEAGSRTERLALLGSYLDGIRATLFRQTMFAEFELEIHERTERGEVLTAEELSALYLRLLRFYHGHDAGVVHIADDYAVEWAAIPHLYYGFYVYQYATGLVAAAALARGVLEEAPQARERYLEFLRSGGSDHPLALLRRAGVDLARAEPYADAFAMVESRLDLLEQNLRAPEGRATRS